MTSILQAIPKKDLHFRAGVQSFLLCHPYIATSALFVGVPVGIMAAVSLSTIAVVLPISLLCSWI